MTPHKTPIMVPIDLVKPPLLYRQNAIRVQRFDRRKRDEALEPPMRSKKRRTTTDYTKIESVEPPNNNDPLFVMEPLMEPVEGIEVARARPCFESEDTLLEITHESKLELLRSKNGTAIGKLRDSIGTMQSGDRVFFKMGQSEDDCLFAEQCGVWQRELGLPFVKTEVVWVKPSIEWWRRVPGPTDVKGEWSATLMRMLGARIKRETNQFGYLPCLIAECFDGIRVTKATDS